MTILALIVYGATLIFMLVYMMDVRMRVREVQDVVAELDRDLADVEAALGQQGHHAGHDGPDRGGHCHGCVCGLAAQVGEAGVD